MTERALRVVVVDDHDPMRAALRTILEADRISVVGEAADGDQAVAVVLATRPDVVLMDLRMPGRDGLSATAELVRRAPGTAVLVLTTFDDDASLFGALAAGAAGFLLKNSPPEDLHRAVRRVASGDAVLDPDVTARVMRRAVPPASTTADLERLTERERDVLWLIARGRTNAEIATALGIGDATAKTHVSNVIAKLGVRDRVQAAVRAHEAGFAQQERAMAGASSVVRAPVGPRPLRHGG
jgi:DNA-binding NarL/FixJ family response regulator